MVVVVVVVDFVIDVRVVAVVFVKVEVVATVSGVVGSGQRPQRSRHRARTLPTVLARLASLTQSAVVRNAQPSASGTPPQFGMVVVVVDVIVVSVVLVAVAVVVVAVVVVVEDVSIHVAQVTGHSLAIDSAVTSLRHCATPLTAHNVGSGKPLHVGKLVVVAVDVVTTVEVAVVDEVKSQVRQSTGHWNAMNAVIGLVQMWALYELQMYGCGTPLHSSGHEPQSTGQPRRRPSASRASLPSDEQSSKPKLEQ